MTISIPIWRGYGKKAVVIAHTIVDDDMAHLLNHRWVLDKSGYAERWSSEKRKTIYIHREVLVDHSGGLYVSHLNADKLDNRRENLALVTNSVNGLNPMDGPRRSKVSCRFRGVGFSRAGHPRPWRGRIRINGKAMYTRSCSTPEEANDLLIELRKKYGIILDDGRTNPNLTRLELP